MPALVVLAAVAVVVSLPLLWWALSGAGATPTIDRAVLAGGAGPVDLRAAQLQRSAHDRAVRPLLTRAADLGRRLLPYAWLESLERRLMLAGRPEGWPIERVIVAKFVGGAAGFGLGLLFFAARASLVWALAWAGLTALAFFLPELLLHSAAEKRREEIGNALPDTLDQMTIAVEAGLGFDAAMARAAANGSGPLADELVRTLQEVQMGAPRSRAMRALATRVEHEELRRFVNAVVQAEGYGIPVADVLRTQAAEQRTKRRQRAEEHAMKIPVKIVFPMIVFILPTLFIAILGPAAFRMARMFSGL
ncbi:type II secretion system F family protein [Egicoccus halophilus]|uniref:Type II secretion system protein n=1 Tax=Egicoccus halophilus TaxID=1670830 RepID=A0A8J3AD00_9ACTN|nr:type II secretion system F family protein [Egicoccus halophilus]GGI04823.1 type II secretion system protein [Egicoccus halophilus]